MKLLSLIIGLSVMTSSVYSFDQKHDLWTTILKENLKLASESNLFNYGAVKKNPGMLKKYLTQLESLELMEFRKFTKNQKLAFWINAYNAYTVKLIVDNYPKKSIKDINKTWYGKGKPWDLQFIELFGKKYSLDDIEHKTIRKNFSYEPRVHFAVNCASMGCPSLRNEAFIADKLNEQLADSALKFIQNEKKNNFDFKSKTANYSPIFKWYGSDFKKKYGSFKKFIEKIDSTKVGTSKFSSDWTEYFWTLNDWKK